MRIGVLECEYIGLDATPGPGDYTRLFEELLSFSGQSRDHQLIPVDARAGLPNSVHDYDAYLITGSYAGVYEEHAWIRSLTAFIAEAHESSIPLVGICFGHQALAHALGGRAAKAQTGRQLGVVSTKLSRSLLRESHWMDISEDEIDIVYMHQDQVVELPPGARNFAWTDRCPYAGFTIGSTVFALQGHPEFSRALAKRLIEDGPERYGLERARSALRSLSKAPNRTLPARWIGSFLELQMSLAD